MPNDTAPTWGTADSPNDDPTSDTVTMVIRMQVGDQVEVVGVGISESDFEYDEADALTHLFTRFLQEAAVLGLVSPSRWHVSVTEDE